mmetsp:Transcript_79712/g.185077  ORF Transcript_79712/g.185077 Transcript_79712/m.185077 type:complete len:225 (-) Transcript_79712:72-746(-)
MASHPHHGVSRRSRSRLTLMQTAFLTSPPASSPLAKAARSASATRGAGSRKPRLSACCESRRPKQDQTAAHSLLRRSRDLLVRSKSRARRSSSATRAMSGTSWSRSCLLWSHTQSFCAFLAVMAAVQPSICWLRRHCMQRASPCQGSCGWPPMRWSLAQRTRSCCAAWPTSGCSSGSTASPLPCWNGQQNSRRRSLSRKWTWRWHSSFSCGPSLQPPLSCCGAL